MADYGAPISKDEADHLYRLPKNVIGPIQWYPRSDGYGDVTVELIAEDGTPMTIRGWSSRQSHGSTRRRCGLALLYRNSVVIRRWDSKPGHRDPVSRKKMDGPHKHYADEHYGDAAAYETTDVRLDDPVGA